MAFSNSLVKIMIRDPGMNEYHYKLTFLTDYYSRSLNENMIPATTIKGAWRWALRREIEGGKFSKLIEDSLFGNDDRISKILVSDIIIPEANKSQSFLRFHFMKE